MSDEQWLALRARFERKTALFKGDITAFESARDVAGIKGFRIHDMRIPAPRGSSWKA